MSLDAESKTYLTRRRRMQSAWRVVGPSLFLAAAGLAMWLILRHPLLVNPWEVSRGLADGTISEGTILVMAGLLPLAVGACLLLLLTVLALVQSAMSNERRLLRIIDRLGAGVRSR